MVSVPMIRYLFLLVRILWCCQFVTFFFLVSLSACRISSSWPSSRPDLCGDHRSPASRDRWLSSPSLPCSAHLCLAVRLRSFRSFLIVLAILFCSWVRSSALHVVDRKRFLSVLLNTPESSSDLCFPSLLLSRAVSATNPFFQHSTVILTATPPSTQRLSSSSKLVAPSLTHAIGCRRDAVSR